jgi:DNA-binding response OmpR family regulator
VLVVDDDPSVRESLVEALRSEGYTVWRAEDGAAALGVMKARMPDLVLLDLMMPHVSGWDVIATCHADRRLHLTPIFVMTAADDVAAVRSRYPTFRKPLNLDRLLRAVRAFLQPVDGGPSAA